MKHPLIYSFFLCSLLSCEKNIDKAVISNEIIAGEYDSTSMAHYSFNPDWVLIKNEIGCHQYLGIDSINIDQQSDWDLKFRYYLYNDIMGECCTDTIGDCFGWVHLEKIIEIQDKYQIHTDSLNWVKPLNKGDIIDSRLKWCNDNTVLLFRLSGVNDPGQGYWSWSNIEEPKYLGIRKIEALDTIYGWILIETKETISIKEYAFSKKPFE